MTDGKIWPPRRIFVDTSAFVALTNRRDTSHSAAVRILAGLPERRRRFVTSNLILAETHGFLLGRYSREIALAFLQSTRGGPTTIVRVRSADEARALQIIE